MTSETWDGCKVNGITDTTTLSLMWMVEFDRNGEPVDGVFEHMSMKDAKDYYTAMRQDPDVTNLKLSRSLKDIYCGWDHSNWVDVTADLEKWYQSTKGRGK